MASVFPASQAIVLGGGLAGTAAANTILENGGNVVLLDKSSFCGGNSTKATSGINGAGTRTQRMKGIQDSAEIFHKDTLRGGAKKPEIAEVLCKNSGRDVEWLMDKFDLDLSLVARLGGHSQPRTHRGKERFPGMTITYALIQMLEKVAENSDRCRIICKAKAVRLIQNTSNAVVGVEYEYMNKLLQEHGPVIIATGGFGADFSNDSLLAQYRPDLMHLPTTNGEHCTGDGIKMGDAIGAASLDLEWVQVHPTGLVKPDDADAKVKFLAAEALRGVGGVLINKFGDRFANELGRRDYVTGEMWKSSPPFRLCLNSKASNEIHWHCEHYKGRGVMKYFASGADLAQEMGIPVSKLESTFADYNTVAEKMTSGDLSGATFPAYPDGKSYDKFGKKFFHNFPVVVEDSFHVAIVTPVIHYCMGGLEITKASEVQNKKGAVIPGLYAAGEVMGGVHGNNRLGGNSLLDCVVFGRVAGKACAEYMLGDKVDPTNLKELAGYYNTGAPAAAGGAAAAAAPAAAAVKTVSWDEIKKHDKKDDVWVVLNNRVLNVTSFLGDHPGGELAIMTFAGMDATAEFDMVHPPDVIEKYLFKADPDAQIGYVEGHAPAGGSLAGALDAPLLAKGTADDEVWSGSHAHDSTVNLYDSLYFMVYSFLREIIFTVFSSKNVVISNDRSGLTRSAFLLILFIVIHAVGNLHVFLGPDDFNGYGYFYVRLYWTGFGFNANIVEEYILLSALMHIVIALKRTWDISLNYTVASGKLNLAITGVLLLIFMTIHLFQFRFGATDPYALRPPPYMVNLFNLPHLFTTEDKSVPLVDVRDIYKLEFEVFQSPMWCAFYMFNVCVFFAHYCLGWQKVVPSSQLDIPKKHHGMVNLFGYAIGAAVALCYISFPVYAYSKGMSKGI